MFGSKISLLLSVPAMIKLNGQFGMYYETTDTKQFLKYKREKLNK